MKLPPPPHVIFGREQEINAIVVSIKGPAAARHVILGGPGIGKTSVALMVLHASTVASRLGQRRMFISCESANQSAAFLPLLAAALGRSDPSRTKMLRDVLNFLEDGEALLVLDNFETLWEPPEDRPDVEALLASISAIPTLRLILTMRGSERPSGTAWTRPFLPQLGPVVAQASLQIFYAISDMSEEDPDIEELLACLGNIPLAITLMANMAQYSSCRALLSQWRTERTAMLDRGAAHRLSNLDLSISLSVNSPRIRSVPDAAALLGVLSLLPDGISRDELGAIGLSLPRLGRATTVLLQTALAYDVGHGKLLVLAPIREYVQQYCPASQELCHALCKYYIGLTNYVSEQTGRVGSAKATSMLSAQIGNVKHVLDLALENPALVGDAIRGKMFLSQFVRLYGAGAPELLERELRLARVSGDDSLVADCLYHHQHHRPRTSALLEEALALYTASGNVVGQIECLVGLCERGDGASYLERAAVLAPQVADPGKLAQSLMYIGYGFVSLKQLDRAQNFLEHAVAVFASIADPNRIQASRAHKMLAHVYMYVGVLGAARVQIAAALACGLERGQQAAWLFSTQAEILFYSGDMAGAVAAAENAAHDFRQVRRPELAVSVLPYLAWAHIAQGQLQDAHDVLPLLRNAADVENSFNPATRYGDTMALLVGGDLAAAVADWPAAVKEYDAARSLTRSSYLVRDWEAFVSMRLGDVALARHDWDAAVQRYICAAVLFGSTQDWMLVVFVLSALADAILGEGSEEAARRVIDAIQPKLERMGAQWQVADCLLRRARMEKRNTSATRAYATSAETLYNACGIPRGVAQAEKLLSTLSGAS